MYIQSFHIDSYGILKDLSVNELSSTMNIFYGKNEAGKSTCLEFFRTMLTGYPNRAKDSKDKKQGGSLNIQSEDFGLIRLVRRPGVNGGLLSLFDQNGTALSQDILDKIMHGVTRDLYRSVYGFSLSELQSFDSLSSEAVKNALYGASFGTSINSPADAKRILTQNMGELYKNSGKNPLINVSLKDFEELNKEVNSLELEVKKFDHYLAERQKYEEALHVTRCKRKDFEDERRQLERHQGVYKQWEEWRLLNNQLQNLAPTVAVFPQDAILRLDRIQDKLEDTQIKASLCAEKIQKTHQSIDSIKINSKLLKKSAELQTLSERKTSFRNAQNTLASLQTNQARISDDLNQNISSLGTNWNIEKIRQTDRSIFVREELESQAEEIQMNKSSFAVAKTSMEKSEQELLRAEKELKLAQNNYEELSEPEHLIDDELREELKAQVIKYEDAKNKLAEKQKNLQSIKTDYSRSLSHLRLGQNIASEVLDNLSLSNEEALSFAAKAQSEQVTALEKRRELMQARKAEDDAKERLDKITSKNEDKNKPDRANLLSRKQKVKHLRQTIQNYNQEVERHNDLIERVNSFEKTMPKAKWNFLYAFAAIFCLGLSGYILASKLIFDRDTLELAELLSNAGLEYILLQVNLPASIYLPMPVAYIMLLVGLLCLTGAVPKFGPDKARQTSQYEQLLTRRDASYKHCFELQNEIEKLCKLLNINTAEPEELDKLDLDLDFEHERCINSEHRSEEIEEIEEELLTKQKHSKNLEKILEQAENDAQEAKRRWHDLLIKLGVDRNLVPSADAAASFFARIEAIRAVNSNIQSLENEIAQMLVQSEKMVTLVNNNIPKNLLYASQSTYTSNDQSPDEYVKVIKKLLELSRIADKQLEDKNKAQEKLNTANALYQQLQHSMQDADSLYKKAEDNLAKTNYNWQNYLVKIGLDIKLSPLTTRDALDCMERCLYIETEYSKVTTEIQDKEKEISFMVASLTKIYHDLQLSNALFDTNNTPNHEQDWLSKLDLLVKQAEESANLMSQKEHLEQVIAEQIAESKEYEAKYLDASSKLNDLLNLASAKDTEDLRRLAAIFEEKNKLNSRIQDLELALKIAADDMDFENFLAFYTTLEYSSIVARLEDLVTILSETYNEEQNYSEKLAELYAKINSLSNSKELSEKRILKSNAETKLTDYVYEWAKYAIANAMLSEAKSKFEKERQPEVIRNASQIFKTITNNKWQAINASLEDNSLRVIPPHGEPISPELLSRGTQEQLYLCLRLAHIRNHSEHAEALPIIMDDILVNFDEERTIQSIKAFTELLKAPAHQFFFFTCHKHYAEYLQQYIPNSKLFTLQNGTVA